MINRLLALVARTLLRLRYRLRVRGLGAVARRGRRGILFLPNHPALIDPVILLAELYGPFRPRALADRHQIDRFLIRRLARRVNVLPIPDVAKADSAAAADEVRRVLADCVEALRRGDNLLLYPAGRAYHGYREDLRGSSAVETILRELPDVRVVLVRTRGLWGSRFSRARGAEPDVAGALRRGARSLLLSGVVFAPRREVSIELTEPADLPRGAGRARINRYLERFYNAAAPPNTYVPYSIWASGGVRVLPEPPARRMAGDPARVPQATRRIVRERLAELTGSRDFDDHAGLARDLGMDSLAAAGLIAWLQSEFGLGVGDPDSLRTVGDVMLAACGESVASAATLKTVPARWLSRPARPARPEGLASMTVPQAFLAQARAAPGRVVLADQASGARTYRDLVRAVAALKAEIQALPGERVGIMMPASAAAGVMVLATLFAGRTPVMVNWTLGRRHLLAGLDSVGAERVLTARAVVSRIRSRGVDLSAIEDRLVAIEDLARRLGTWARLKAYLTARFRWAPLRAAAARAPRTAAVLFTSGSETLPKAVPLTHANVLANVADAYDCFTLSSRDAILGILPPFHSFGLTVSVLLPLCVGVRAVYSPDPTDGGVLARTIEAYGATILVGTPTFLHGVVRASAGRQLSSLRLVVSGAEKCSPRVYDALARRCRRAVVIEGYGVTECSPVISVNRERDPHPGTIGKVLGSLEHAIVDPQTGQRLEPGREGVLLVRGPSVFEGYVNYDGPSPFVELEGRRWYRTGDLVKEDASGVLTFCGRLGRFVKLGGEMVSLPAIEAVLEQRFGGGEGPTLAVTAAGAAEAAEIVLFTTGEVDRESANRAIRQAGLSGLHNVRRVIRLDELPLLGTGKIDYRALAERLGRRPPR